MNLRFALGLACAALPALASAQAATFAGVNDVPLMPGLTEVPEVALVFVTPEGRIIDVEARGRAAPAAVRAFYATALPPLGWQAAGEDLYTRGREALLLSLDEDSLDLLVRIAISPAAAP